MGRDNGSEDIQPSWLVVLYVFGVEDEVRATLNQLDHLRPTARQAPGSMVFITLAVSEPDGEAAGKYAKTVVERSLRRSAMIQSVVEGPPAAG